MRVFVAVNRISEIGFRQTTALLIAALANRVGQVFLFDVEHISVADSMANAGKSITVSASVFSGRNCNSKEVQEFARNDPVAQSFWLAPEDLVLIRTNPGRDRERSELHSFLLDACQLAKSAGTPVINDPQCLRHFENKSYLASLDSKYVPTMIVTNEVDLIVQFVQESNCNCVIKPVIGSRGENVIRVSHDSKTLEELISRKFNGADVIVQHFVKSDVPGDKRIVVLDGEILEIDNHIAGIERRPAEGDFRGNLHAGGTAHPLVLNHEMRAAVSHGAETLHQNGIRLAGIDLVGTKIIEFNVFSTGGLYDAQQFSGVSFSDRIAEVFLEDLENPQL